MALVGCKRCGRTGPPYNISKSGPPTQEIALFLHSGTKLMACQKEKKKFFEKNKRHYYCSLVVVCFCFFLELSAAWSSG